MNTIDRLGVGDLATFWSEGPTSPMHIGLAGLFSAPQWFEQDGTLRLELLRQEIDRRTRRVPLFRRKVRWTSFGEGLPLWTEDQDFDISRHVAATDACTGMDAEQFFGWAAQHALEPLDRGRPLWRAVFAPTTVGSQVGLLLVVHHVAVDGLAGVAALSALLGRPGATPVPGASGLSDRSRPVGRMALVRDNAAGKLAALEGVFRNRHVAGAPDRRGPSSLSMLRVRAPQTPLSGSISGSRLVTVLSAPLHDVARAADAFGVTVNDLALSVVTAGLRSYLTRTCVPLDGLTLRASMPIAVPGRRQNASRMVVVPLPVHQPDPAARLGLIASATAGLKSSGGDLAHADVTGSPLFPRWLARLGLGVVARHGSRWVNCYVTNVRGPADRLSLAGAPLERAVGIAPLVAGIRLGVTVFSYAGELTITLLGDGGLEHWPALGEGADAELSRLLAGTAQKRAEARF